MPSCPHCMYNGFIMNDLYDYSKKIALTYTLMPSLRCKRVRDAAFFLIIMLVTFAATL